MQKPASNAPQADHQLKSGGYGLERGAHPGWNPGELPTWFTNDQREAAGKVHGVPAAMPQGQELGAYSVDRSSSERGNHRASLPEPVLQAGSGIGASSAEGARWGGGPVVVRGRESRPHGEVAPSNSALDHPHRG